MSSKHQIENISTLSPLQEGLLFHTLHEPEAGLYFQQMLCTLDGEFNVTAFKAAWQAVISRHPILRTSFVSGRRDKPFQVVHRQLKLPLAELDWRGLAAAQQGAELEA